MADYGEEKKPIPLEQFAADLEAWLRLPTFPCQVYPCNNCQGSGETPLEQRHLCAVCSGLGKQCVWRGKQ